MKKIVLLVSIFISQIGYGQVQDAWVFFADKDNVENIL